MNIYDKDGNPINAAYDKDGNSLVRAYTAAGVEIPISIFKDTAVITNMPYTLNGTYQGGCTDDTYIYLPKFDSTQYTTGKFIKYNIAAGTYTETAFTAAIPMHHCNDMCYNPNNGHLYVAPMDNDGSVVVLDSRDWSHVETLHITTGSGNPVTVWQFCFDRLTNKFYVAAGDYFLVYDQQFNYEGAISVPKYPPGYTGETITAQGCETDGTYIYRVWYNPNKIDVLTMAGEYVTTIDNPMQGEPETLMFNWTNGEFYCPRNFNSPYLVKVAMKNN